MKKKKTGHISLKKIRNYAGQINLGVFSLVFPMDIPDGLVSSNGESENELIRTVRVYTQRTTKRGSDPLLEWRRQQQSYYFRKV